MNVTDKLKGIFANIFSVDTGIINENTSPEEIEDWDSLQHLNLVLAIREEFGINITPEESTEFQNFGLIVKHIEEKLIQKEKGAATA